MKKKRMALITIAVVLLSTLALALGTTFAKYVKEWKTDFDLTIYPRYHQIKLTVNNSGMLLDGKATDESGAPVGLNEETGELTVPYRFKHGNKWYEVTGFDTVRYQNTSGTYISVGAFEISSYDDSGYADEKEKITSVVFREGITNIGTRALASTNIASVTFPQSGLKTIGDSVFSDCKKLSQDIAIPDGVTSIGDSAFARSAITSLTMTDSVTKVGAICDECSSLTKVRLSDNITNLSGRVFIHCGKLSEINLPKNLTVIGQYTFMNTSSLQEVDFPEGLISIGESAFQGSGLTKIELPSTLTTIGTSAFAGCKMETLVIPANVTSLGGNIASNCTNLVGITFEGNGNFTYDEHGVLYSADGKNLIMCPAGLELDVYEIKDGTEYIEAFAFDGCNKIKSLIIPSTVNKLGGQAFQSTGFTGTITIPEGVTAIPDRLFQYANRIEKIVLPSTVKTIGSYAFNGTSACKEIVVPENTALTSVHGTMFAYASGITSIYIPSNLTITSNAFGTNCNKLSAIIYGGDTTNAPWGAETTSQKVGAVAINPGELEIASVSGNKTDGYAITLADASLSAVIVTVDGVETEVTYEGGVITIASEAVAEAKVITLAAAGN